MTMTAVGEQRRAQAVAQIAAGRRAHERVVAAAEGGCAASSGAVARYDRTGGLACGADGRRRGQPRWRAAVGEREAAVLEVGELG